jgi:phosphoglycerate dehydrogenase-like enzyme
MGGGSGTTTGSGGTIGCGSSASWKFGSSRCGLPHLWQNRASSGSCAPQVQKSGTISGYPDLDITSYLKELTMPLTLLVLSDPKAPWLQLLDRLGPGVNRIVANDPERVRQSAPEADVLLNAAFGPQLLALAVPLAARAKWIHSLWTGVDNVLSPEVIASPIPLTNGRGVFRVSLAEWSIGAMLYFSYNMRRMIHQQEAGIWEAFTTEELAGRTLGIVGFGEIGRAAAERARAFGMRILALRRRAHLSSADALVDQAFPPDQINALMAGSDYILVAAPLTPETRGLVGAEQIAAMKPTGVILNVGRGAVIDEAALIRALETHKIRGAALDVFSVEPLPAGHPFFKLSNVLLSPHTADHVQDFVHLAAECFLDNFERFRSGQPVLNIVDKHAGY